MAVPAEEFLREVTAGAEELAALNADAHAATKLRARAPAITRYGRRSRRSWNSSG